MLTLRFALFWTTLLVVVVAAGVVADVLNGATPPAAVDRLNWEFLSGVALGPIALFAVGQFAVVVTLIVTRRMSRARRDAEAKAAAWKAFVDGVG